jgi:hypothetical protein
VTRAPLVVVLVCGAAAAHADTLTTRGVAIRETAHAVEVHVGDVATYRVRRDFTNRDLAEGGAELDLEIPEGAVATGLRLRARGRWEAAELTDHEAAAAAYMKSSTGKKRPALLEWIGGEQLRLRVHPIRAGETVTVEYLLTVPLRFSAGTYKLAYPRAVVDRAQPAISVAPAWADERPEIRIDGRAVPAGVAAVIGPRVAELPKADRAMKTVEITVAPRAGVAARYGRAVASPGHAFTRLEVDAGPLSRVPVRAQVVFAVDTSFSAPLAAQLDAIRAYATHVPDAEVELVAYNRRAARVFGEFVPATTLDRRLGELAVLGRLAPGNGSALDAGARLAATAIAERTGARRIVLFTDELVRSSLGSDATFAVLVGLAPEVIVHVVVPSGAGIARLLRDDRAALAALATRHHGIFARFGGASGDDQERAALAAAALELVRPTRLERVEATGFALDTELREGDSLRVRETPRAARAKITLKGVLWSDEVVRELDGGGDFGRATAGFVFGEALGHGLRSHETRTLAYAAHAVTPVTSFVSVGAGTRSRYNPATVSLGRVRTSSHCGMRFGHARALGAAPKLRSLVDTHACEAAHAPRPGWKVTLTVETTRDEVVDVAADSDSPFAACLVESVWNLRLDPSFASERHTQTVELR